jgi:cyclophilin family peptidyl-prolyl cis-trans isomerase
LVQLLKNGETTNVRVEAAAGLVGQPEHAETVNALLDAAGQDKQAMVRAAALTALTAAKSSDPKVKASLKAMTQSQPSPWLQGKAYLAWAAQLQGDELSAAVLAGLQHKDPYVQREIIAILPTLGAKGLDILAEKAANPSILIAGAAVSTIHDLDKEKMNDNLKSVLLKQLSRHDSVLTSSVIDAAGKFGWADTLPQLLQAAGGNWKLGDYPVQENLMATLAVFADPSTLPVIEKNLQHPVRNVVVKAAEAWQKVTGKPLEKPIPINNKVADLTPALTEINEALSSEIILETSKGRIRIFMLDDAPLTATKVIRWARQGFYNGLNFHRVVPHWVVQGGDPRGDGEGGDGLIRDEVSMTPHLPYTLGIATSGKDTGSTQMFFNLGNNTRLDGSYTVFAQVMEGRDVVDRLEIGDKIIKATVLPIRGM